MKTEHYPGPWGATMDEFGVIDLKAIVGKAKILLARFNFSFAIKDKQRDATINLICAAPELLEALVSAQKFVDAYDSKFGVHPSVKIKIQDAINKAKGLP